MVVDLRLGLNVTNMANTSGTLGEALRCERENGIFHQCGHRCKMSICLNSLPQSPSFVCPPAVMMMGVSWKYTEKLYKCLYKDAFYSYIQCLGPLRVEMHGGCRRSFVSRLGFVNTVLSFRLVWMTLDIEDSFSGSHLVMCCHST